MKRTQALLFLTVLLASVGCDQASKQVASSVLADAGVISMAAGIVRFELVHNPGAFLSLGVQLPEIVRIGLFTVLVPLVLVFFCVQFLRTHHPSTSLLLGLGLFAGGGFGNWLDRLFRDGAVTDFVSLGVGSLRTGIFNVADLAVISGVALLLWRARELGHDPEVSRAEESS